MTIQEIKARHESLDPTSYFFSRSAMKYFNQTLRSFSVMYLGEDTYEISAPIYRKDVDGKRRYMGMTKRIFDYNSGKLTVN
jgi:hypothetical protein